MIWRFSKSATMRLCNALPTSSSSGFGIIIEIDIKQKLEAKIGTILPCNVIVRERTAIEPEVAAIDPVAFMQAVTLTSSRQPSALRRRPRSAANRSG